MKIKEKIKLKKNDVAEVLNGDVASLLVTTYTNNKCEMPPIHITIKGVFVESFRSFNSLLKFLDSKVEYSEEKNDVSLALIFAANNIAVKNRRGAGNILIMNKRTYKKLSKYPSIFKMIGNRFYITINRNISSDSILVAYVGQNIHDKFMFSVPTWFGRKYKIAVELIEKYAINVKITDDNIKQHTKGND